MPHAAEAAPLAGGVGLHPGYRPGLALRHLLTGAAAPRRATGEALAAGLGEPGRILVFLVAVLCLALVDPETRQLGSAALQNVADDASPLAGAVLLAVGAGLVAAALLVGYWAAAFAAAIVCGAPLRGDRLARSRSAVVLASWFALLPTVALKVLALATLPAGMVAADPPSLYSALELVVVLPYLAACLLAVGAEAWRSVLAAALVNGLFYGLIAILYLLDPSS